MRRRVCRRWWIADLVDRLCEWQRAQLWIGFNLLQRRHRRAWIYFQQVRLVLDDIVQPEALSETQCWNVEVAIDLNLAKLLGGLVNRRGQQLGMSIDLLKHLHCSLWCGLCQHWNRIDLSDQRLPCVNGLLKVGKIVDDVEPPIEPEWLASIVVKLDSAKGVVPLDNTNVLIDGTAVDGQRTSIDSDRVVMNQDCHEHPSAFLLGRC